jgi:ribonucleoside-diphosphate reductase beta chain
LEAVGFRKPFSVNEKQLKETEWFNEEMIGTKHTDFFFKRSINYSKRMVSIKEEDIF